MNIVKNLDRSEMERQVLADIGGDPQEVHAILSSFFQILGKGVALKGYAEVHELGSFKLRAIPANEGILPDGTPFSAPNRVTVDFNPFQEMRENVEAVTGVECIL